MDILIITPFYAPDFGPSAPLFTQLSSVLAQRGHRVTVIAAVPHYPSGKVLPEYKGKWIRNSVENGVKVIRVAVPSLDRSNFKNRLLQFICYQIGATCASLFQRYDVALVTNPAIETWLPFAWQVLFRRKPVLFSVFDVYPNVGIKLGIFKNKLIIVAVTSLERFCLKRSASIQVISDSFRPGVRALGVPDSKIDLVYLWVDTDQLKPITYQNSFASEQNLNGKYVVLYAGNIGLSQGLEHVLTAAELLADQNDVQFVFVGDGAGRELLQTQAKQRQLSNVQFVPFQPRERLPEVLASADAMLVILRRGISTDSLPSKTFSALASGRPIIASVDEESETWKLIKRAEAGLCCPPEDPARLAETILSLKQDKNLGTLLGRNGRLYAEKNHSVLSAAEQFEKLFIKSCSVHPSPTHSTNPT